jgi:hypothetical protein
VGLGGTSGTAIAGGTVAGEAVLGYVLGCVLQVERTMEPVNAMTVRSRRACAAYSSPWCSGASQPLRRA